MRKKNKYVINWKNQLIWEPTVLLYWTYIVDPEQFFNDLFEEIWAEKIKLDEQEVKRFLKEYFETEDEKWSILNNLTNHKIQEKIMKEKVESFHTIVWRFILAYPSHTYHDVMNMPLSIFNKFLDDYDYISWKTKTRTKKTKWAEKWKLKKFYNMQK